MPSLLPLLSLFPVVLGSAHPGVRGIGSARAVVGLAPRHSHHRLVRHLSRRLNQPLAARMAARPSPSCSASLQAEPEADIEPRREESPDGLQEQFVEMITRVQEEIIKGLEGMEGPEGARFNDAPWTREADPENGKGGGYGRTRVMENGRIFEKAAASISVISGNLSPERAKAMSSRGRPATPGATYSAAALSLVFHPVSPLVPTFRADVRMFGLDGNDKDDINAWFGGGADLTPSYLDEQDAREFHRFWKGICDRHDGCDYNELKEECDKYFYLPARGEHRGIGGIFFDDMPGTHKNLRFVTEVAERWIESYQPIVERHQDEEYSQEQKDWQLIRRGRYAEFNMLWDRGVRFGLLSGGDIERIMVSAPPVVRWAYDVSPEEGTPEATLIEVLRTPRDWIK